MVRHHLYSIAHDLTQAWAFSREAQQRATQSPELLLDLHDNDASETFFAHIENAVVHTSGAVVALADTDTLGPIRSRSSHRPYGYGRPSAVNSAACLAPVSILVGFSHPRAESRARDR